eukprot:Pgem_evm1s14755
MSSHKQPDLNDDKRSNEIGFIIKKSKSTGDLSSNKDEKKNKSKPLFKSTKRTSKTEFNSSESGNITKTVKKPLTFHPFRKSKSGNKIEDYYKADGVDVVGDNDNNDHDNKSENESKNIRLSGKLTLTKDFTFFQPTTNDDEAVDSGVQNVTLQSPAKAASKINDNDQ